MMLLSLPRLSLVLGTALLLGACDRVPEIELAQGEAQGTQYHIKWWAEDAPDNEAILHDLQQVLDQIDQDLSTYRDDSWISRFNESRDTDWQSAPESVIHLLLIARRVHERSEGCYDPTVSPLFTLWGFQSKDFRVPDDAQIDAVLTHTGLDRLEIDEQGLRVRKQVPELSIDLSSMGEGFSVDQIAAMLERHGIHNYLAELGGDMRIRGTKPDDVLWRVGIESPTPGQRRAGNIVTVRDRDGLSINTSGTYRRYFDDQGHVYSHIIDPRSGRPTSHDLVSATVFGTEAAVSDAWATTMLCLGRRAGLSIANQYALPVYLIERYEDDTLDYARSQTLEKNLRFTLE